MEAMMLRERLFRNPPSRANRLSFRETDGDHYLIDTGAIISVFPVDKERRTSPGHTTLYAANDTTIRIFGTTTKTIRLGFRRTMKWKFVVADVNQPTIGCDFLDANQILVDVHNQQIIDARTGFKSTAEQHEPDDSKLAAIEHNYENWLQQLLDKHPKIDNPTTCTNKRTLQAHNRNDRPCSQLSTQTINGREIIGGETADPGTTRQ